MSLEALTRQKPSWYTIRRQTILKFFDTHTFIMIVSLPPNRSRKCKKSRRCHKSAWYI